MCFSYRVKKVSDHDRQGWEEVGGAELGGVGEEEDIVAEEVIETQAIIRKQTEELKVYI